MPRKRVFQTPQPTTFTILFKVSIYLLLLFSLTIPISFAQNFVDGQMPDTFLNVGGDVYDSIQKRGYRSGRFHCYTENVDSEVILKSYTIL